MRITNEPVSKARFMAWHDILADTGGRYIGAPRDCGDHYRVTYEPGDYKEQQRRCRDMFTPISEIRRDQWWRRMLRRLAPHGGDCL